MRNKTRLFFHTIGGQNSKSQEFTEIKASESRFVTWKAIQGDDKNHLAILLAVSRISHTKAHVGQAAQHIFVMSGRFFPTINSIDCFWWVLTFHGHILS